MSRLRNTSKQTFRVLNHLFGLDDAWIHGYALGKQLGLKGGTLSPLLRRLETCGYLESRWEMATKGPPRREYRLSLMGLAFLRERIKARRQHTETVEGV
jgi:PadR family transcriptional regulator, regulatory protein PadR